MALNDIRKGLKEFWTQQRRSELSSAYKQVEKRASQGGDYAKCLKEAMENGTAGKVAYAKCASQNNLGEKLANVWGSS